MKHQKGFTAVELTLVLAMLAIWVASAYVAIHFINKFW